MDHYIRLPRTFVIDREQRDLSCGETTDKPPHQILCICDDTTLADMLSDADYQAMGTDQSPREIVASAKRAHAAIKKYLGRIEA